MPHRSFIYATVLMLFLVAGVSAANPHYVTGPDFVADGLSLTVSGSVAGLGHGDIDVTLDAVGLAEVECRNPGGNVAPGQDTEVDASATETGIEVKNGRADYSVSVTAPATVDSSACPNPKWTAEVVSVDWTSATVTVVHDSGVLVDAMP